MAKIIPSIYSPSGITPAGNPIHPTAHDLKINMPLHPNLMPNINNGGLLNNKAVSQAVQIPQTAIANGRVLVNRGTQPVAIPQTAMAGGRAIVN